MAAAVRHLTKTDDLIGAPSEGVCRRLSYKTFPPTRWTLLSHPTHPPDPLLGLPLGTELSQTRSAGRKCDDISSQWEGRNQGGLGNWFHRRKTRYNSVKLHHRQQRSPLAGRGHSLMTSARTNENAARQGAVQSARPTVATPTAATRNDSTVQNDIGPRWTPYTLMGSRRRPIGARLTGLAAQICASKFEWNRPKTTGTRDHGAADGAVQRRRMPPSADNRLLLIDDGSTC